MKKDILFIKVPNKLEFQQRIDLKESVLEMLKQNDLDKTITPIVLENGIDASIFDKSLCQKIADNTDAIKEHTAAVNTLIALFIESLGLEENQEQQESQTSLS